jgi:peptide/nickel transport system substrate-binding protein
MIDRTTKLRWRRRIRQRKRQVEDMSFQAEERLEQHFFKRLARLAEVRRFVLSWLLLLIMLIGGVVVQTRALSQFYQVPEPAPGGAFTEGILGSFTNANPMYAAGSVDNSVARLVFSGLMKYDENNHLVGDLAERYDVDASGVVYTVRLKKDLRWHDDQPLTADDVVFTYHTIQNPDAKSPLLTSWQNVKVSAKDARTVVFTLPNTLSSFPHSLTNGIVPKHLLRDIPATQLRSVRFNTAQPVGSGPFKWEAIEVKGTNPEDREEQIGLIPNPHYHAGAPKLQHFIIRTFREEKRMLSSLQNNELNAAVGLETVPDTLESNDAIKEYNVPLTGQTAVFFKTTEAPFDDVKVRQALVQAVDVNAITSGLGYPVRVSRSPFLTTHIGYDKALEQLPYNTVQAKKLLEEAGWKEDKDGIRKKGDQPLTFRLYSQSTSEYSYVSQQLQSQWRAAGVDVQVMLQDSNDLQTTVAQHTYGALLYGISLGVDPDVFPFWHSSQALPRSGSGLNFSEYHSVVADKALEGGRTRSDVQLRAIKYKPFLEAWRNDAPALVLYQPRFLYVTHTTIYGFEPKVFNNAADRYNNVENWMIRETKTSKAAANPITP